MQRMQHRASILVNDIKEKFRISVCPMLIILEKVQDEIYSWQNRRILWLSFVVFTLACVKNTTLWYGSGMSESEITWKSSRYNGPTWRNTDGSAGMSNFAKIPIRKHFNIGSTHEAKLLLETMTSLGRYTINVRLRMSLGHRSSGSHGHIRCRCYSKQWNVESYAEDATSQTQGQRRRKVEHWSKS